MKIPAEETCAELFSAQLQRLDFADTEIQIWLANLDTVSADEVKELFDSLDPTEQARAGQFHFDRDRRYFVAAHGLVRHLLGETLGQSPAAILFDHGAHGKPAVRGNEPARHFHFNLSHSAGWALFALAWDREVGVDLENGSSLPNNDRDLLDLAKRVLSKRELNAWNTIANPAARRGDFLRAWTRKEACVKAIGEGMHRDLSAIDLLPTAESSRFVYLEDLKRWIVQDLPLPSGFAGALATEGAIAITPIFAGNRTRT